MRISSIVRCSESGVRVLPAAGAVVAVCSAAPAGAIVLADAIVLAGASELLGVELAKFAVEKFAAA